MNPENRKLSDRVYILVDPIGSQCSGITLYVKIAWTMLIQSDFFDLVLIIKKKHEENIEDFRLRLVEEVGFHTSLKRHVIVEAPETYASTLYLINMDLKIHIRLHFSSVIGKRIQNTGLAIDDWERENKVLSCADYISSPSFVAEHITRSFFKFQKKISNYPNPIERNSSSINEPMFFFEKYVLFVGRWQNLKGIYWISKLAKELDHINFLIVTDYTPSISRLKNVKCLKTHEVEKNKLYESASCVVLPSIFETASMVGLEAHCYGCPVVFWKHLGLYEYLNEYDKCYAVDSWDYQKMKGNVISIWNNDQKNKKYNVFSFQKINEFFIQGFKETIEGKHSSHMPSTPFFDSFNVIDELANFENGQILPMIDLNESRLKKKFNKLISNPSRFWKDSKYGQSFSSSESIPKNDKSKTKPNMGGNDKTSVNSKLFGVVFPEGKIEFKTPPEKPVGVICALFYPIGQAKLTEGKGGVIDRLGSFDDFQYLAQPQLQYGAYSPLLSESSIESIVERIDLNNKIKLSSIDHLILIDPPTSLAAAFRTVGTRQRIIAVITDFCESLPDPLYVDVLVNSTADNISLKEKYRRVINIGETGSLEIGIRRAVQEGVPKTPDMFLPIVGFDSGEADRLMAFNSAYNQCLIHLDKQYRISKQISSMSDIHNNMAKHTIELAVLESVYLKYRTILDNLDQDGMMEVFYKYAAFDGVITNVER